VWENVRDELQDASNELLEDEANGMPLDVEVEFMGLRLEYRSVYVLQVLCNGQYTAFVQQFTDEQPRYHDRPSDADDALRRDDDFPAPTDILLLPLRHGDEKTIEMVVALTLHHIAYACNLFAKTEYAPTDEAVEALMEWGVYQISSMLSEPMGRMPLRARKHCAGMNIRGVQESVVSKGRQVLRGCPDVYVIRWVSAAGAQGEACAAVADAHKSWSVGCGGTGCYASRSLHTGLVGSTAHPRRARR
jgi:hypothetical protein